MKKKKKMINKTMKMKRIRSIALILSVCIIMISTLTYANSGPSYWEGKQSSEILTIKENSKIAIEKEDLIFDFKDEDFNDYSLSTRVTAKYIMSNKAEKSEKVQMAFPLISSIQAFRPDNIDIRVDSEQVDFQVYLGDIVYPTSKSDVEDMKYD